MMHAGHVTIHQPVQADVAAQITAIRPDLADIDPFDAHTCPHCGRQLVAFTANCGADHAVGTWIRTPDDPVGEIRICKDVP